MKHIPLHIQMNVTHFDNSFQYSPLKSLYIRFVVLVNKFIEYFKRI